MVCAFVEIVRSSGGGADDHAPIKVGFHWIANALVPGVLVQVSVPSGKKRVMRGCCPNRDTVSIATIIPPRTILLGNIM